MNFTDTESQLESIEQVFAAATEEDKWDLTEDMLYSYYFVDEDVDKLEELGLYLDRQGYDFIDVFELGDEETGESTGENLLHIDKVETHTPQSLAERNVEFSKLAQEYEIASYDGWEFGEVGVYDEEDDELDDDIIE
ncbi:MAG: ribonuclease E inhibitor RraB [Pyrinomonadaceae bacterium]